MPGPELRQMVGTKRPKFGTFVIEFDSPGMGQILKAAGCEYALLDMEHSGFTYDQLKRMLRNYQAADLPVIVSTVGGDYDMIARALDVGADGIQPAKVGSAEEARAILEHVRYPPKGSRGVAVGIAHDRYVQGPPAPKLRAANRDIVFFPKIETPDGIAEAEKIAALEGVGGIWVGHFDLSVSMGIPAQFDHKDFRAAMRRVSAACKKHGKSLGRIYDDTKTGKALYKNGFDFLCCSGDSWLVQRALGEGIMALRAACRGPRRGERRQRG
jgi:2-dehydro-3-deoxyglucarate aldolase/4-hydroxy-2-oxoheptanedioate aldolase